jgi:hypothetical protein
MADGRWQMADGRWQMADGRWQMADGRWQSFSTTFRFRLQMTNKKMVTMVDGRWQIQITDDKQKNGR